MARTGDRLKYHAFTEAGTWLAQLIDHDILVQGRTREEAVENLRVTVRQLSEEPGALSSIPHSDISHGYVRSRTL